MARATVTLICIKVHLRYAHSLDSHCEVHTHFFFHANSYKYVPASYKHKLDVEHAYTHRISGSCTYRNVYTCMYANSPELCLPHIVGKVCTNSILSTYTVQEHIVEHTHTKSRSTQWRKYTCTYTIQRNTVVEVCTHTHTETRKTQWRWRSVSCTHLVPPHISTTQGIFICQSCFFL